MTLVPTQNNVQPVNEMVSPDTRDLMLVLITRGKELHLTNIRFIAVYGFCIKICELPKYIYESEAVQYVYRLDIR